MTGSVFQPIDADARERIQTALDETLLVEAGAGTGKTHSLVSRVVALVAGGFATLDRIAAITFTEAAAAELRDRIREGLEVRASETESEEERARCERGVEDLDQAAIQTLHSFAGALLGERPLEAGLPPSLEVLDEIRAGLFFEEQWQEWLDSALESEELREPLRIALSLGLRLPDLREAARRFHERHDLVRHADFPDVPVPPAAAAPALAQARPELEDALACARNGEADPLAVHVREVCGIIARVAEAAPDPVRAWRLLARSPKLTAGNRGRQPDWETHPVNGINACKHIKDTLKDLQETVEAELAGVRRAALAPLLRAVRGFVVDYAEARRLRGQAEFQDLLVWARDLLRDDIGVRDYFRHKFTHLLIDEFQDTDPIQAEIALYLAEEVPPGTRESQRPRRWEDIQPQSGKLFVVGDPKQSIYRFRQADITLVNRLRDILGVDTLPLVQNFRSHRPVIEWANHVFGQWMVEGEGQPPYAPLHWKWEVAEDDRLGRLGPAVHALGGPLPLKMPEVRRAEARAVARLMQRIRAEGWQVRDGEEPGGGARFRPALYRDVCLLVPRRTGLLRDLELTLEDAGVPYRLESASLVFDTQEVRDLLNCLEAVDNPVDGVALVAALRSPAFACSDVDLVSHLDGGGRLDYLRPGSNAPEGPVSDSLHALAEYHEQARWQSFPMLVERFVRGRKLLELALDHPRPREQWRRYQFVIDRARAFAEAGGTSLRAFLQWMREQQEEHARAVETPVPEGDEDAIRVLTIHGSKGLEFPIVVLADLGGAANAKSPAVLFRRQTNAESSEAAAGGAVHVHLGQFETLGYQGLRDWELEREQEEQVRLMYVASTRAKDHLVVSRFQVEEARHTSAASTIDAYMNGAEHLWSAVDLSASVGPVAPQSLSDAPGASATHADSPISREEWITQREHVLRLRSRPAAIAATTLAHEQREERGTDAEPWRRGRAGTSIGRAVHAVLQTIDLATGKGLEETARAQAQAEGLPERESEVAALAKHALSTDAVRRAVESGHWWREVPVGIPIGDGVLEGFIDLLFEEDGGLVVVDYKTDAARDDAAIDGAMERYRLQGAAYALAVERVTGLPVRESIFVFLQPRREIAIDGLREAMADAEQAAAAYLAG